MSEATTEPPATTTTKPAETASPWEETFKGEDPAKVRKALDHAREWEKRAKDNAEAAKRLAEIEEAKKTDDEKAADRLKAIEDRASKAEQRAVRFEIAAEFGLSPDNAKRLEHVTTEDGMREIAQALAEKEAAKHKQGNRVPGEGRTPTKPGDDPMREFARNLFGRED